MLGHTALILPGADIPCDLMQKAMHKKLPMSIYYPIMALSKLAWRKNLFIYATTHFNTALVQKIVFFLISIPRAKAHSLLAE